MSNPLAALKSKADCDAFVLQLQQLTNHPGWRYFDEAMKTAEEEAYGKMTSLKSTPHEMALAVGSFHTIRRLRAWPTLSIQSVESYLKTEEENQKRPQ